MAILLIGIGNPLRGDDGVGPLAAQCLHQIGQSAGLDTRLVIVHQATLELADALSADDLDAVIFIDARVDALPEPGLAENGDDLSSVPGSIHLERVQVGKQHRHAGGYTHYYSPSTIVAAAAYLYDARPPCWVLALPAAEFGFCDFSQQDTPQDRLSPHCRQGLATVAERGLALLSAAAAGQGERFAG